MRAHWFGYAGSTGTGTTPPRSAARRARAAARPSERAGYARTRESSDALVPGTTPWTPDSVTIHRSPSTGSTAPPRHGSGGAVHAHGEAAVEVARRARRKPLVYAQSIVTLDTAGASRPELSSWCASRDARPEQSTTRSALRSIPSTTTPVTRPPDTATRSTSTPSSKPDGRQGRDMSPDHLLQQRPGHAEKSPAPHTLSPVTPALKDPGAGPVGRGRPRAVHRARHTRPAVGRGCQACWSTAGTTPTGH